MLVVQRASKRRTNGRQGAGEHTHRLGDAEEDIAISTQSKTAWLSSTLNRNSTDHEKGRKEAAPWVVGRRNLGGRKRKKDFLLQVPPAAYVSFSVMPTYQSSIGIQGLGGGKNRSLKEEEKQACKHCSREPIHGGAVRLTT